MADRDPIAQLPTHEVTNQVPPLENVNLFDSDAALKEAFAREGAGWATDRAGALGAELGSEAVLALGDLANRHTPELRLFDRYGHRIDEVTFHPAYHELMALAMRHGMHNIAWTAPEPGGHVAHAAFLYMITQAEPGICCPMSMTYASVAALRHQPDLAAEWEPALMRGDYDPRSIPAAEKTARTMGMAMTEKQGGSDVRTNTTRAVPAGAAGEYELTGHKWFCSAPMSDGFLTLAYTETGLTCFLTPRWRPDGRRNAIRLQRLKDKLGNRSNASAELEFDGAWARMVGADGRGVATIIDMVHHTRLDTAAAPAGMMRQATAHAIHHATYRTAFQRRLIDQPLMRNVLADLALESEAAVALILRVARGFDDSAHNAEAKPFARLAVAIAKYWLNKRVAGHVVEAMECLGGAGYVEESAMPRLYREAPVNGIWEGSGNVICLDILRTLQREPAAFDAFLAELERARGGHSSFDAALDGLKQTAATVTEAGARHAVERMAMLLQAALLLRHAPDYVADAFCAARPGGEAGRAYGTLPEGVAVEKVIARAAPTSV